MLDIPVYKSRIQSLHALFSLYAAFKNSQVCCRSRLWTRNYSDCRLLTDVYRAMHYSAKHGLAIACRPCVSLSLALVDCDHIGKLKMLETTCAEN